MAKKKPSGLPTECAACGSTEFDTYAGVMVCSQAMCPAVGRLEHRHGNKMPDDKIGWYLDGRQVKSVLQLYGSYPPDRREFTENDPDDDPEDNCSKWGSFSTNICSKFLFPNEDNGDITHRLEKAGVIKTKTDSESGCMYVYFDTKEEADGFYTRLWNYLRKRWLAIHDLKKQLRELP